MNLTGPKFGKLPIEKEDGSFDFVFYKAALSNGKFELPKKQIFTEIKILGHLKSNGYDLPPYYLHFFSCSNSKGDIVYVLITSFIDCAIGDLNDTLLWPFYREYLKENPEILKELFLQIAQSLNNLHEKGIIYRDLKPENIMITKDNEPIIIDFGISCIADEIPKNPKDDFHQRICGTYGFMPFGIGISSFVGPKYDWYTFGKTMMYCADFIDKGELSIFFYSTNISLEQLKLQYGDERFAELVYKLTRGNYDERLDFEGIKNHPYFTNAPPKKAKKGKKSIGELGIFWMCTLIPFGIASFIWIFFILRRRKQKKNAASRF